MRNIPKLIDSAEALSYEATIRNQVVDLVEAQLLREWRYWIMMIIFIIAATISAQMIESTHLHGLVRILITFCVFYPGTLLWSFASWRLQRWVLAHRRKPLLHAMQT
jgi:hypothetical protein